MHTIENLITRIALLETNTSAMTMDAECQRMHALTLLYGEWYARGLDQTHAEALDRTIDKRRAETRD